MSTSNLVRVTIDGQELSAPSGAMIIEVADQQGITIPRFCYHKKLTVAANCRMCLVDVANSRKPLPACATPVADGMVVYTKSPKALSYQKAVMEFLLINHPLDCPICDQGGECELQDLAMGYGKDVSRYNQGKRSVEDKDIGPLIETDLTRCIQCTRCVRFGTEIAGLRELGMIGRGEHSEIATFLKSAVDSELSGNVIDLCPVGALTNKPFQYQARPWELQQYPLISPHDAVGSHLYAHVRRGQAMRVVPRENEALNEVWLSDRDRYSIHALNSEARASEPMIRNKQGQWEAVDWVTALEVAAKKLKSLKNSDPNKMAALASSQCTVEEFYLLQKLMRGLECPHIDFRGQINDFTHQQDMGNAPGLDCALSKVNEADVIVVVGCLPRMEAPIFNHRLRQAALNGAKIFFINPLPSLHNFEIAGEEITDYSGISEALAHIAKLVTKKHSLNPHLQHQLEQLPLSRAARPMVHTIAEALLNAKRPMIFAGSLLLGHPALSENMGLWLAIKEVLEAQGGIVTPGPNYVGGYFAGALPHRGPGACDVAERGKNIKELLDPKAGIDTYLLLNTEPYYDTIYGSIVNEALDKAKMVIAITPFVTDYLKEYADVILPMNAFAENSGTYINFNQEWQSWQGAAKPKGEARPGWKILRVLANLLSLPGFDYGASDEVIEELKAYMTQVRTLKPLVRIPERLSTFEGLYRLGPTLMYAGDMLVRHSPALQETLEAKSHDFIGISPALAKKYNCKEGEELTFIQDKHRLTRPIKFMNIPDTHIYLAHGTRGECLGNHFDLASLEKRASS